MLIPGPTDAIDNERRSERYDAELIATRDRIEREVRREEAKRQREAAELYAASAKVTADRERAIAEREQAAVAARERNAALQQSIDTTADPMLRALALIARATRDADAIDAALALASERTGR